MSPKKKGTKRAAPEDEEVVDIPKDATKKDLIQFSAVQLKAWLQDKAPTFPTSGSKKQLSERILKVLAGCDTFVPKPKKKAKREKLWIDPKQRLRNMHYDPDFVQTKEIVEKVYKENP
eukprot:TRINITY_DN67613_c8_g1_i3.p1 TRINITY_DN67613_c8_g1~~TRINITY_DN67613_c8_g1_i3.p1  ORF type:complete len:118 (-),score=17.72 TRINITY_DN67613_c8_g1_i3:519-872(-)